MSEQEIPERVRRFVVEHVTSLAQLEVLLLLHAQPQRPWEVAEVARKLGIDTTWAAEQLAELGRLGLVSSTEQPGRFLYRPATPDLALLIDELAIAYAQRRVTLITLIFSKPVDKVRTFADAFRIRPADRDTTQGGGGNG